MDAIQEQHLEWPITVLDILLPKAPRDNVAYEIGDVTDLKSVTTIIDRIQPKVIIHTAGLVPELAGRYGRKLKERVWDINVNGTRNMLSAAKKTGVEAFVWTGSCCAVTDDMRYQYPNIDETWPTSNTSLIYGESKASNRFPKNLNISPLTLSEGSSRSPSPLRQHSAPLNLFPPPLRPLRSRRLPTNPLHPRHDPQTRNPLHNRPRLQSLGRNLRP